MEKENIYFLILPYILENLVEVNYMEKENFVIKMVHFIKEIGKIIVCKDMESIVLLMVVNMKVKI